MCQFYFNRVPQPQFLGSLVEIFSSDNSVESLESLSNTTVSNVTTAAQRSKSFLLGHIVAYARETYPEYVGIKFEMYFYATAVVATSAFNVVLMHPYLLCQLHLGMKIRVAMCSMIYRKSLRLSKNALGETTVGQVVNLLSNDVGRLDLAIIFLHFLWVGPLETIIVTYLMYLEVILIKLFALIIRGYHVPL